MMSLVDLKQRYVRLDFLVLDLTDVCASGHPALEAPFLLPMIPQCLTNPELPIPMHKRPRTLPQSARTEQVR